MGNFLDSVIFHSALQVPPYSPAQKFALWDYVVHRAKKKTNKPRFHMRSTRKKSAKLRVIEYILIKFQDISESGR